MQKGWESKLGKTVQYEDQQHIFSWKTCTFTAQDLSIPTQMALLGDVHLRDSIVEIPAALRANYKFNEHSKKN